MDQNERENLVAALVNSQVDVPRTATIPSLRRMIAQVIGAASRNEDARLKQELFQLDQEMRTVTRPPRIGFMDVSCAISPFTGEDGYRIEKWLLDFNIIMDAYGAPDEDKLLYARRMLDGYAQRYLTTITIKTWTEFNQIFIEEFGKNYSRREIYKNWHNDT
jgi:hypothetical protein